MAARGPLSGITVVDLSRILAGPYATLLMAEMGARVIKIEPPSPGDDARAYGPYKKGVSTYFSSVNRGKESISLDLKAAPDKKIFEKLLERADVIVENFRPGTMEKLGYGWEALHARYPKLIYAAASGFGHSGPHSTKPSYDMVVQGLGGIMSITGHPGQPPVRIGMSIGDVGAGLYTATAINAALFHRAMTGEATKVDIAMFDCQIALLENAVMRYTVLGEVPGPLGARHPSIVPFEGIETKDGWMILAAGNDSLWLKVCEGLARPDLATDPRYTTNDLRSRNRDTLRPELVKELTKRTTAENVAMLEKAGVPCGPINNVEQALAHPQVAARNMLITVEDPEAGTLKLAGNPIKFSAFADPPTRDPAPTLDRDRAKILKELGL